MAAIVKNQTGNKNKNESKNTVKGDSKKRVAKSNLLLIYGTLAACTQEKGGLHQVYFNKLLDNMFPCHRLHPPFLSFWKPEVSFYKALSYQLAYDPLRAHMTRSNSSLRSLTFRRGAWLSVCICRGWGCCGKKGGQLCWKLSLPCAFAPFILGSKHCVCVHVRVNVSEYLCVFVEEPG